VSPPPPGTKGRRAAADTVTERCESEVPGRGKLFYNRGMAGPVLFAMIVCASYLLGSFPTGVVLSRQKYGIDVREMGSGNIGATNVTRVFGWYAGILVFLLDLLKGAVPLWILYELYPTQPWLLAASAFALVLGHCFSVYLRFGGGKGVATSLGCLLVVAPWAAVISGLVYVILLVVTRISAIGSLAGILATLAYLAIVRPGAPVTWLVVGISIIVVVRHQQNIRRLLARRG
jgi:glycerol-3-phosphate acyltransferase PlsY